MIISSKNTPEEKNNSTPTSSKGNQDNNKKNKDKGAFKGKNKLTPDEMEAFRKENKCFKCGEQGHGYRSCPKRNERNDPPWFKLQNRMDIAKELHCPMLGER